MTVVLDFEARMIASLLLTKGSRIIWIVKSPALGQTPHGRLQLPVTARCGMPTLEGIS